LSSDSPAHVADGSRTGALLWGLLAAFFLRVAGQLLVVAAHPAWLPPMEQWYSGLIRYPLLLPIQVVLLGLMGAIARDVSAGQGRFAGERRRLGVFLTRASMVYAGAMVARYVVRMVLLPDQRWLGGTIPIVFHLVLASFMYLWARELRPDRDRHSASEQRRSIRDRFPIS
jgi:hypothetical protein